jgi:HD-GYP domain-containing protein (c-di-GMP phosphodiesterase class II)
VTIGVAARNCDCDDLRQRVEQLERERLEILGELEEAYERFAHSVDDSRAEADLVYHELRDKAESLERRVNELVALADVARNISSILQFDTALACVVDQACALVGADAALLFLCGDNGELLLRAGRGPHAVGGAALGPSLRSVVTRMPAAMHRPMIAPVVSEHALGAAVDFDGTAASAALLPLHGKDEMLGVLVLLSATPGTFCPEQESLFTTFSVQASVAVTNARLYRELERTLIGILIALATALEAKDPYTEGHSSRVAWYAVVIGKEMGLGSVELENLHRGGLIHDIGKIGIGGSILRKPGPLNEEEWQKMRMHPLVGADIISSIEMLSGAMPGVRQHHERWDGSGYPDGLAGEDIPLIARVMSVADAFDALTTDRSYRKGCSADLALAEIQRWSGTQFDPRVVEALERCLPEMMDSDDEREMAA